MGQSLKLKLVFGRICSGKGHYTKNLEYTIVVSKLVRDIVMSTDRSILQNSLHLDENIANSILFEIEAASEHHYEITVDGIRQISIVHKILEEYPDAELIWLEVPTKERKRRYEARMADKDVEPFEIADNKPIELECQKIYEILGDKLKVINNY
jgi:hypothetical protein